MPNTVKRNKDLLTLLLQQPITLAEAMVFYANSTSKPDHKASALGLRQLESHELIRLRQRTTQEITWFEDEMLQDPADYDVIFNGYGYSEQEMSEVYEDCLAAETHEITRTRAQVALESSSLLSVDGDLEGAATLVERARAFTHQFAFYLINRNYMAVAAMFSAYLRARKTAEDLAQEITRLEKTCGDFELFDHVAVQNIYNGSSGWKAAMDRDWWPGETDKKARRAVSSFQLGSLVTPGGVIIEGYHMSLSIIQEEDLFRVQAYSLYSGN